jgi:peptide-methionine (S)-S-oxide reductase
MGCFWCGEEAFEKVPGVVSVVSGYTDGRTKNPSYEMVSSGTTGHTEAVEVKFRSLQSQLRAAAGRVLAEPRPDHLDRQFCDGGTQYRPASTGRRGAAQGGRASKAKYEKLKTFKQPIVTPIVKASQFWPAEDYHQDYYKKNPVRYKFYANGCGRYARWTSSGASCASSQPQAADRPRSRSTASGSPARRAIAPRCRALLQHLAAREDLAAQLLRRPGQEELGLDQALWKNATIASRSFATSPSRRALMTMRPGTARAAPLRRRRRSILLKTSRRGTSFAPISSSTSSVTASCRS